MRPLPRAALVLAGLLSCAGTLKAAGPAQVILIRHAEKPPVGDGLSAQGLQRAEALVGFFQTNPDVTRFGPPAAIYAMKPKEDGSQARPLRTVEPLANALGLSVDTRFQKDEAQPLAASVLGEPAHEGKPVLIAWEHHMIPALAKALGATQAPESWPGEAFDRAWVIDFDGGKPVAFRDVPQRLLPGDSAN